ncbi:hypothetical protein [Mucilaginibacter pocheonensis]|uniref:Uncharacterized protein n=1 Tax=Mucilaginibacter pocheonensis TaxID=398050 RepID=A0ABU1T520_9SPHI|nr:hypothetical protein [Mucilaginibacter pocheonensis]MDR6940479.1 hypothetical protein [Mucilaginibacter pocheonensis]
MLQQIAFIPQHQFHVLINFKDDERILAILPSEAGRFRVVDQGKVIAEVGFKEHSFICCQGKLDNNIMTQLEHQIKNHYA